MLREPCGELADEALRAEGGLTARWRDHVEDRPTPVLGDCRTAVARQRLRHLVADGRRFGFLAALTRQLQLRVPFGWRLPRVLGRVE